MSKKWIAAAAAVLIIIAAAVCLLPKRTHVEVRMTGTLLYGEKIAAEPVYVTVQGALSDAEVDFRFLESGIENWLFTESTDPVARKDRIFETPYIISSCGYYNVSKNCMATAWYAFSPEEKMLLVYIMDDTHPVIACSADGEKTIEDILEYFSVFVDQYGVFN